MPRHGTVVKIGSSYRSGTGEVRAVLGTQQVQGGINTSAPARLSWHRMLRLGMLGLASDIRDRYRDPALRKRPLSSALIPRLDNAIFIVGAPRSGTTFLGNCIGRLPEVSYHFEPRLTKAAAQHVYDGSWSKNRSIAFFRMSYSALLLANLDGGRRFTDKNPENSFLIPFLASAFPDAQFVHIVRDGRDVAVSHAEKPWLAVASAGSGQRGRARQPYGPHPRWWVEPDRRAEFSTVPDIVRTAWCWRRFTEAALEGLATLPADRVVEVRYEAVVVDPMTVAETLGEFLGTSSAGLDALRSGLRRARPDSVGRWQKKLQEHDLAEVDREIGPLLNLLGYS
jgi:Sulfotransferase family